MRAGPLSDPRVRKIIGDNMVGFYFNFRDGKDTELAVGHDEAARLVHQRLLEDTRLGEFGLKTGVPPAIVTSPGGDKMLGLIGVNDQFNAERFRRKLLKILRKHDYLQLSPENEQFIQKTEEDANATSDSYLKVAAIYEAHADLEKADEWRKKVIESDSSNEAKEIAFRSLINSARLSSNWSDHKDFLSSFIKMSKERKRELSDYFALENAIREIRWKDERDLESAITKMISALKSESKLHDGALHYYLGVAKFLNNEKDEAFFHWWAFIQEYPDHPLHLKAYINLASNAYPFPIPELDGFVGSQVMMYSSKGSPASIERKRTRKIFQKVAASEYGKSFGVVPDPIESDQEQGK